MKAFFALFVFLVSHAGWCSSPAHAAEENSPSEIAALQHSVVLVTSKKGFGTGFMVSPTTILTARHILNNQSQVLIRFYGTGKSVPAQVVRSTNDDIAELTVSAPDFATPVPIAADALRTLADIGAVDGKVKVLTIGHNGQGFWKTVEGLAELSATQDAGFRMDALAGIEEGFSGAPVCLLRENETLEVIGMIQGKLDQIQGMSAARFIGLVPSATQPSPTLRSQTVTYENLWTQLARLLQVAEAPTTPASLREILTQKGGFNPTELRLPDQQIPSQGFVIWALTKTLASVFQCSFQVPPPEEGTPSSIAPSTEALALLRKIRHLDDCSLLFDGDSSFVDRVALSQCVDSIRTRLTERQLRLAERALLVPVLSGNTLFPSYVNSDFGSPSFRVFSPFYVQESTHQDIYLGDEVETGADEAVQLRAPMENTIPGSIVLDIKSSVTFIPGNSSNNPGGTPFIVQMKKGRLAMDGQWLLETPSLKVLPTRHSHYEVQVDTAGHTYLRLTSGSLKLLVGQSETLLENSGLAFSDDGITPLLTSPLQPPSPSLSPTRKWSNMSQDKNVSLAFIQCVLDVDDGSSPWGNDTASFMYSVLPYMRQRLFGEQEERCYFACTYITNPLLNPESTQSALTPMALRRFPVDPTNKNGGSVIYLDGHQKSQRLLSRYMSVVSPD